jgi:hypothetical protein
MSPQRKQAKSRSVSSKVGPSEDGVLSAPSEQEQTHVGKYQLTQRSHAASSRLRRWVGLVGAQIYEGRVGVPSGLEMRCQVQNLWQSMSDETAHLSVFLRRKCIIYLQRRGKIVIFVTSYGHLPSHICALENNQEIRSLYYNCVISIRRI